jgi:exodeoxyribonuclease X
MNFPLTFIDTETTGIDEPEVIELAIITGVNEYVERFLPQKAIDLGAIAVHGILPEDLADCRPSSFATSRVNQYDFVVGHNIDFDLGALHTDISVGGVDFLGIARTLYPDLASHKLGALFLHLAGATRSNVDRLKSAHSALTDTQILRDCWEIAALHPKWPQLDRIEDLFAWSEHCKIPTKMGFGKHKGKPISEVDYGYVKWYRSQPDPDRYYLKAFKLAGK